MMKTEVKLTDLLREYQEAEEERRRRLRGGGLAYDVEIDLDGIDCNELAGCVMRGLNISYRLDPRFRHRIDLATLVMQDTMSCIVGQAFGWGEGIAELYALDTDEEFVPGTYCNWVARHGFDVLDDADDDDTAHQWTYYDLDVAWRLAIENFDYLAGRE